VSEGTAEVQTAEASQEQAATEAASIAAVGAVVASGEAQEARETANEAVDEAAQAQALAAAALVSAEETREAAGEAIASVASRTVSREEFEAWRAEMEPVREYFANAEAERVAREQAQTEVQEVSVEDGIGTGSETSTIGNGTGDNGPDRGTSSERRSGLRHRGRR
jgi:hypothetical protein